MVDMHRLSCLNGWGFGNLGISAGDAAAFFYDLLGVPLAACCQSDWDFTTMVGS